MMPSIVSNERILLRRRARKAILMVARIRISRQFDRLLRLAARAGFHPVIRQHAQQLNGLLALVAAGVGLALVPASMQVVKLAGISYVPLADPDAYLVLAVASPAQNPSPVVLQCLETVATAKTVLGL